MTRSTQWLGISAIILAIAFNIPFSILGSIFDYPDILRQPAAEVLNRFHAGGVPLVMTWFAFMVCAILLVPFSVALSSLLPALQNRNQLSRMALISGSLAGILQAIGLSRWVFVVPMLASHHVDPNASIELRTMATLIFETLNLWGGVAIGEHLGQIFTCLFVASISIAQFQFTGVLQKSTSLIGLLAVLGIAIGLGEGIAIALEADGSAFSIMTVIGYLSFSIWMILTGISLMKNQSSNQFAAG